MGSRSRHHRLGWRRHRTACRYRPAPAVADPAAEGATDPSSDHRCPSPGCALIAWFLVGRRKGGSDSRADLSRRMRHGAETLGPTYIKLGQIISSGEGIFPTELVQEFCRLPGPSAG